MALLILFLILSSSIYGTYNIINNKNFVSNGVYATSTETYFARILTDNVYLYKNPIETDDTDYSNIYFKLPKSYFVELLDSYDSNFYFARYLDMQGYVKKHNVQSVVGKPRMPYLDNLTFRIYNEDSQDMRKLPTPAGGNENHETFVSLNTTNLTYYGEVIGESLTLNRTKIWYYCRYTTANKVYFGYIYSDYCDDGFGEKIVLPLNTEEVEFTLEPDFSKQIEPEITSLPVESKTTWIVIIVLSIPALIFLIMLLKSSKFSKVNKVSRKEIMDY